MSSYIIIAFPVVIVSMIAFGAVFFYQRVESIRHQQKITLKTLYVSVRELRSLGYRVDGLATENRTAMQKQEKLLEHHRAMLASLGRQLGTIETMLAQKRESREPARPGFKTRHRSVTVGTRKIAVKPELVKSHTPISELISAAGSDGAKRESGAILLEKLFNQSRKSTQADTTPARPAAISKEQERRLAAARALAQNDARYEERRVSNG